MLSLESRKAEILALFEEGYSRPQVCSKLEISYAVLLYSLNRWGLSEKCKNQGSRGRLKERKTASFYLKFKGPAIRSHKLKLLLWQEGLKKKECEECGWAKVSLDGRLPLELHHVDGKKWNNLLSNLQVLCPNCHALKPGNSGAKLRT